MPVTIGAVIGIGGAIGKMIGRGKANKEMGELLKKDPRYTANPLVQQRLGLAQTLLNARSPGAANAERNIYSNQANSLARVNRNSTDASQALSLAGQISGQSNQAFGNLEQQETGDYQRRLQNLEGAQEGVINEDDKVFNDNLRRYNDEFQVKGAQQQNRQNNWGDISNLGFGLMDFGMGGGFGKSGAANPQRTSFGFSPQQLMSTQQANNPQNLYQGGQSPTLYNPINFWNRPQ